MSTFHALPLWQGEALTADFARVDGDFTATTDQIIRWAACKWGLDENALRAEAWYETNWIESSRGDKRTDATQCQTPNWNGWDGTECWQSYGMFQAKVFDYNIWPEGRDSTAFNSDFRAAYLRACMNGDMPYLSRAGTPVPGYRPIQALTQITCSGVAWRMGIRCMVRRRCHRVYHFCAANQAGGAVAECPTRQRGADNLANQGSDRNGSYHDRHATELGGGVGERVHRRALPGVIAAQHFPVEHDQRCERDAYDFCEGFRQR